MKRFSKEIVPLLGVGLLALCGSVNAELDNFMVGFDRNSNSDPFRAIYLKTNYPAGYLLKPENEAKYFALDNKGVAIQGFGVNGERTEMPGTSIRGIALSRWGYEPIEAEVLERFNRVNRNYRSRLWLSSDKAVGCLDSNPLRYGDIEGDGKKELVLFLDNDMLVFSTEHERIVFMVKLKVDDWFSLDRTEEHWKFYPPLAPPGGIPYYQSATNVDYSEVLPGYRGYAKIYTGDFDNNGLFDIVVWRKLYESHVESDGAPGFKKLKDTLYHFEKPGTENVDSTGEYQQKDTGPGVIQGWLNSENMDWSTGFPSESECEGREGELIQEMHDPLLNDPEVLQ